MRRCLGLILLGVLVLVSNAAGQFGIQSLTLQVTPKGVFDPNRAKNSSGHTTNFDVTNNTTSTLVLDITCSATGGVSCSGVTPSSVTLPAGGYTVATATYSVGSLGGTIRVQASDDPGVNADEGYKVVTTPPTVTLVIPTVTNPNDTALVHTRTPLIRATYSAADATLDTTTLVVKFGTDTVTPITRRNRALMEWEVDVAHQLTPGVNKDLIVKICHNNNSCTTVTRHVILDNSGTPIVSFTGMPLEYSSAGAEVEAGFATPAYQSFGVARSVGLVYSTRQAYPRALVNVDIELTWPVGNPDQIKATLFDGAVRMDSLIVANPVCSSVSGRRCRVTLQADFAATTFARATRKYLTAEVRVTSGGTTKITADTVEVILVDRRSSPYGAGWFVAGVGRLDSLGSDMVLVGATGGTSLFRGSSGLYLPPPGASSALSWTGSQWELKAERSRGVSDGSKLIFDAQGRLWKILDTHSNVLRFAYGAVDRVDTIIDPVSKKYIFTYSGGKLTTITDPGSRQSKVTIDASNRLTYDSMASAASSPTATSFSYTSYGANNTWALSSRTDALGQTTTYAYDARRRPYQTTYPAVLPETGSTPTSAIVSYRAQVLRGLDSLLSADSIFSRAVDARGFWTRSVSNRWGGVERVWDSLGTLSRASYAWDGRVLWQEGKVPDSTRVYFDYDQFGRLIRRYRLVPGGTLVLLDSMEYHPTANVVTKSFSPIRQATTFSYNGYGDLLKVIRPGGDTTVYQYASNGQLDRIRRPYESTWTIYTYNTTWRNVQKVTNSAGTVLAEHTLDAFGRVTETRRKLVVRVSGSTTYMRWRRSLTGYQASNAVDSVRSEITNECTSPCTTPPTWGPDSLTWQHVRHAYDRLGRDTARYNTRDKRTRYVYDGLGRLRARYPFADSAAVVDSFRYDVAGNLRYHWTRRGNQIEHRYDSRGRDTATIVPGVGTYRRQFAGPNDELTRMWIDSYSDAIGGVQPAVSWVFNQQGQLLSDTAQGNRVGTYIYDRYGRDSITTDVRGTTLNRYDAARGVLDTIITPFGDTLRWVPDSQWRPVGPYVANGSAPDFSLVQTWNQVGKLTNLVNTHVVTVGQWQAPHPQEEMEPEISLLPTWTEQRGSGGATVTGADTLSHDGWGRVTKVRYLLNGSHVGVDSMVFDRDGNMAFNGAGFMFDVATTRLKQRALNGDTIRYTYDRSGNLVTSVLTSPSETWSYTYDALERLVEARLNSGLVARYAYDVLGRRIVKRNYLAGGSANYVRMIYGGDHVIAETDSLGSGLTLGYTWGLGTDDLVAVHRYSPADDYYVVKDLLRTVRGVTKKDGTWLASWRYKVYGYTSAALDSAGSVPFTLRYRWNGREYDAETGLYYFRARYYASQMGRFTQEDPIGFSGGTNLYTYGDGDPVGKRDPDGLSAHYDQFLDTARPHVKGGNIYEDCWADDGSASAMTSCLQSFYGIGIGASTWYDHIWGCRAYRYLSNCEYDQYVEKHTGVPTVVQPRGPDLSSVPLPRITVPMQETCTLLVQGLCDDFDRGVAQLMGNSVFFDGFGNQCGLLGTRARNRMAAGKYYLLLATPYYGVYSPGSDRIGLDLRSFFSGILPLVIAHEEAHGLGYDESAALMIGEACGGRLTP